MTRRATMNLNATDRIVFTTIHKGTIAVRVSAMRLMPYPEGTLGHSRGWLDDVEVYGELVPGTEEWQPTSRNKIGGFGAFADVTPAQAAIDDAIERAKAALRSAS